jgi:hypothetical protein
MRRFQDQVYGDFKTKYMTLIFSFQSNEASYLEHFRPKFSIVIPRSEKEGMKPPYVCPGCSNHMHGNNMINRCNVVNKRVIFLT